MALKWKYLEDVPLEIIDKYLYPIVQYQGLHHHTDTSHTWLCWKVLPSTVGLRGDFMLALTALDDLEKATLCYWDRNLPKRLKHQIKEPGQDPFHSNPEAVLHRQTIAPPIGGLLKNGCWMPFPQEVQECCKPPNLKFSPSGPSWGLKDHCATMNHIANLFNVPIKDLRTEIERLLPRKRIKPNHCAECGKFASKDSKYCKIHKWANETLDLMEEKWKLIQLQDAVTNS